MIKRLAIVMLVLFGTVLGLILLLTLTHREPAYRGKRLSAWFDQYARSGERESRLNYASRQVLHKQSARALRAMGTNAVPWLLTQCFRTNEGSFFATHLLKGVRELIGFAPLVPVNVIQAEAAEAIREIKPPASLLLPKVTNLLNSPNQLQRWIGMHLLGSIGDGAEVAVPFLRERLRVADPREQEQALEALAELGPAAKAALPDLLELLNSSETHHSILYSICFPLGSLGSNASAAIPALKQRMATETNVSTREFMGATLCRMDARETAILDLLTGQIKRSQEGKSRWHAASMLKWIGPNAKPVVPVLQEMLKLPERQEPQEFEDLHAWQLAVEALLSIGETNLAVSDAMQKLKSKDTLTRVYATEFLNSAQPTNAAAIASLIEFLRDPTNRHWAVENLGECGAAAKAAVPILREITSNRTNELRHAAMQVLEDIEAAAAEERDAR